MTPKWLPGPIFWAERARLEIKKSQKPWKKKVFLTEPFFEWFLEREKPLGLKKPQINGPRLELKNYVSV